MKIKRNTILFNQYSISCGGGAECYDVEVQIPTTNGHRQPDYAFFRETAQCQDAKALRGAQDYWRQVSCLGDAKRWTASLDKKRAADENPSAQICNYLYRSRVRWGILTNGRVWRLYEREKSSAGGIFYEVNLEDLLRSPNPETFKYFYLFFRREAFIPDSTGMAFVEKVFQGSVNYATEVGDRLKESVYDALRLLMDGCFEYQANGLNHHDPATVQAVYENCLILLYRLLFLLYAEDRELPSRSREPYSNYSLYRLQKEINQRLHQGHPYLPLGRDLWGKLMSLFGLIDEGYPAGNIPAYNGGLFSPAKYPHIAHTPQMSPSPNLPHQGGGNPSLVPSPIGEGWGEVSPPLVGGVGGGGNVILWEIGDHRLAEVIDMLAYQREIWNQPGTEDIDYTTLDVQHLGSIYEGLLELQPQIATEVLIETIENGKLVFKPQRDVTTPRPIRGQLPRTINPGEVYLVTNRGERKATGSYYTPKYIVDYIVENTLEPLAEEASRQVEALRPEVEQTIKKLEKTRREWEKLSPSPNLPHQGAIYYPYLQEWLGIRGRDKGMKTRFSRGCQEVFDKETYFLQN